MNDWIRRFLQGFLPDETIEKLRANYDEYCDAPLANLGLDSMAVMGLVLNIETEFGKAIDYQTFQINSLETLAKARVFIGIDEDGRDR